MSFEKVLCGRSWLKQVHCSTIHVRVFALRAHFAANHSWWSSNLWSLCVQSAHCAIWSRFSSIDNHCFYRHQHWLRKQWSDRMYFTAIFYNALLSLLYLNFNESFNERDSLVYVHFMRPEWGPKYFQQVQLCIYFLCYQRLNVWRGLKTI